MAAVPIVIAIVADTRTSLFITESSDGADIGGCIEAAKSAERRRGRNVGRRAALEGDRTLICAHRRALPHVGVRGCTASGRMAQAPPDAS
jgi:hypothetical protein